MSTADDRPINHRVNHAADIFKSQLHAERRVEQLHEELMIVITDFEESDLDKYYQITSKMLDDADQRKTGQRAQT